MGLFNSIWKDAEYQIKTGNIIVTIILINVVVFVAVSLVPLILMIAGYGQGEVSVLFQDFLQWVAIPYDLKRLLFRPWTIITHMFLHYQLGHIFWNMLLFYWFARILKIYVSEKKILPIYVYGAIVGVALSIMAFNLFPTLGPLTYALGASAGVMAILLAAATLVPDHAIYLLFVGNVKIKYIALVIFVLDLIAVGAFNNVGGHIAHLGGAAFGYLFIRQLQKGNDWSLGFNSMLDSIVGWFKPSEKPKVKVVYKRKEKVRSKGIFTSKAPAKDVDHQTRIDQILDKINQSGYDSLSKEDKDFLFKVSNEDKSRSD